MELTQSQVTELARHFVEIREELERYYSIPENKQAFEKWHLEKYGCKPEEC